MNQVRSRKTISVVLLSLISRKCVWRCRYFTISLGQYLLEIAASMSRLPLLRGGATRPESEFCQTLRFNDIVSVDLLHAWDHRRINKTGPPPVRKGHFVRLKLWRLRVKFTVGTGNNASSSFSNTLSVWQGSETDYKVPWELLAYFSSVTRRKESVQLVDGRGGGPVGFCALTGLWNEGGGRGVEAASFYCVKLNAEVNVSASFACGRVSRQPAADEALSGPHKWPKFLWNFRQHKGKGKEVEVVTELDFFSVLSCLVAFGSILMGDCLLYQLFHCHFCGIKDTCLLICCNWCLTLTRVVINCDNYYIYKHVRSVDF